MYTRPLLLLVAACALGTVCAAADFPARKPGLWEITMNSGDPQLARAEKVCLDKATDQLMYKMGAGMSAKMCSKTDIHTSGSQVMIARSRRVGTGRGGLRRCAAWP